MSRPTSKAPTWYRDWHELYHELCPILGRVSHSLHRLRLSVRFPDFVLRVNAARRVHQLSHRLARVEAHMHECQQSNDPTWKAHEAYVEALFDGRAE